MTDQQQHFRIWQWGHSVEDLLWMHSSGEQPQSMHLIFISLSSRRSWYAFVAVNRSQPSVYVLRIIIIPNHLYRNHPTTPYVELQGAIDSYRAIVVRTWILRLCRIKVKFLYLWKARLNKNLFHTDASFLRNWKRFCILIWFSIWKAFIGPDQESWKNPTT